MSDISILKDCIDNSLLHNVDIKSVRNFNPVVVKNIPKSWILLGVGNYAAVFMHVNFPDYAVKIYATGKVGIKEEIKVYNKINNHPSYSKCFYYNDNYLILKRLKGKTIYTCLKEGIQIPKNVISDIDEALSYAKKVGLNPYDVHAKNVMIVDCRGIVVDVSDFTKSKECTLWKDFKNVYYKIYVPFLYKSHPAIPEFCLDLIRRGYRIVRRL